MRLGLHACAVVVVALAAALALIPSRPAHAAEAAGPAISVSGELDVNSHYVWRGIAYSRGMVVNPSVTVGWHDLSLNLWSNVDHDAAIPHAMNEVDWTLGWSHEVLGIEVKPSLLNYTYPFDGVPATTELMLELGHVVAGPVSSFVRHSVDVHQARGAAFSSAGLACELPARFGISVSANAAWNRGSARFASAYADPSLAALDVASAGVSATVPLGHGFSLRPHADVYRVGDRHPRADLVGASPFVWGLALDGGF